MDTNERLKILIEKAASIVGSQRKLAAQLGIEHAYFMKIKRGDRPANWQLRGRLRIITGESPEHAFTTTMAEDLEESGGEEEKKAAAGFRAMLAAFPDELWRRRRDSNPR